MWMAFVSAALAAPLSEVADEAVALQRERGEPVVVALSDGQLEAAWSRLELPADALLIPVQAPSAAEAFDSVQGLDCGVLVTGEGPEGYQLEAIGACGVGGALAAPGQPRVIPQGWESTHSWTALGLSASALVFAPRAHLRIPTEYGMFGVTAGFGWFGARGSLQLSTRPRQGGSGLYVGGEVMLRGIEAIVVGGVRDSLEDAAETADVFDWFTPEGVNTEGGPDLTRTTIALGLAPIVGAQHIREGGLFLSAQAGPQLLLLSGEDLASPVQLRVSVQLLVGFVPRAWRG